ncbi:MAG: hypothetical protein FJ102_24500 [Deltaproteobacteria bacterium]|nr:hypothetical protein [Deltaproteobacteria bacterium]
MFAIRVGAGHAAAVPGGEALGFAPVGGGIAAVEAEVAHAAHGIVAPDGELDRGAAVLHHEVLGPVLVVELEDHPAVRVVDPGANVGVAQVLGVGLAALPVGGVALAPRERVARQPVAPGVEGHRGARERGVVAVGDAGAVDPDGGGGEEERDGHAGARC